MTLAAQFAFCSLAIIARGRLRFPALPMRANLATFGRMTVEELKAEAAKLPPDARFALAEWIECNDDVRALRREELIREIQHGIEQADRGELLEGDEVFARLRSSLLARD